MTRAAIFCWARRRAVGWWVRDVLVPFAASRAMLALVGTLAVSLLAGGPIPWEASNHAWINAWSRWDSGWYLSIVENGYRYDPERESSVAFFPLFPVLMHLISLALGRADSEGRLLAGMLIANAALLVAVSYLIRLARLDVDDATAARAGLYLLVFPTSFFLSAVYAESLFLALVLAAFYHARSGRWWLVGSLGGLAALTRPQGVLIVAPLALEYFAQHRAARRPIGADVLALGLVPASLLAFMVYLHRRFGDPLAFLHAQAGWGRQLMPPWAMLDGFLSRPLVIHGPEHSALDLVAAVLFTVLVAASWRRARTSHALFASLLLVTTVSTGSLMSMPRYGVVLFPIYVVLAGAGRHPWFDRAYVIVATGLASLFMAMFARWYWVA